MALFRLVSVQRRIIRAQSRSRACETSLKEKSIGQKKRGSFNAYLGRFKIIQIPESVYGVYT